ncbi:carbohydrate ABC transporter permease [Curtobacterium sp. MCBA15_013]|uniref:carbohydrate ABC transporter permease n=1 Tax=Curtobacterium sp. MCBA15_013 TaxID=1898739 RepID=UPI0009F6CA33|nr:carbohydrate ABC transporter permease [Curtobacterium sp. MCBA15_013]
MTSTLPPVVEPQTTRAITTRGGPRPPRRTPSVGRVIAWIAMIAVIVVTLFPFYWILRTALSSNGAISADPTSLLPTGFSLGGFERVFGLQSTKEALAQGGSGAAINFWQYLLNSVLTATMITVGQVFFSAGAAYAFARLRWPGRDRVFAVFLAGLMVPTIFTLLPNFTLIKSLGLVDTLFGIALPSMLMTPFAVFFLRQFFLGISREVEEAALIDGAGKVRVFFRLILPMASAPIATLAVLTYITAWNDYFWPLMVSYTDSSRVLTVALGVFKSQSPQSGTDWAGLMAATLVAALPMIVLFGVFAKRIVNSIGFSGIK